MDFVVIRVWFEIAYGVLGLVALLATITAIIVLLYYIIKNNKK